MSEHVGEKCGKQHITFFSKFTKRHNSFKNPRKVTILELDLKYIKTVMCKISAMSKRIVEKCGKRADGDPDGWRVGRT